MSKSTKHKLLFYLGLLAYFIAYGLLGTADRINGCL